MNNNNVDADLNGKTALNALNYAHQYVEYAERINNELNENYNTLLKDYKKLNKRCIELEKINSNYQSALGNATNFRFDDNDKNNTVQLTEDILRLQDALEYESETKY
jgi:hypothetical protein